MIVRVLMIAAAALAGGAALSRRVVDKEIEKRLPLEIEIAKERATAELEKRIGDVISERLLSFGLNIVTKAGLIGGLYLLYAYDQLTLGGFRIAAAIFITLFICRDILTTLPYLAPAYKIARRNKWSLPKALRDLVAGLAFERAYAEALATVETGPNRRWLAFSKYTAHSISTEVAEAVAEVARSASYKKAKQRAIFSAFLALTMAAAYSGFVFITFQAG